MGEPTPVLRALTPEAREAIDGDEIQLGRLPFRVGRESRVAIVEGRAVLMERRKPANPPNNDLYLIDRGRKLNVSRAHCQIERLDDGSYQLLDRGSACGTIVNDRVIGGQDRGGACALADGDTIVVGKEHSPFVFQFQLKPEQV